MRPITAVPRFAADVPWSFGSFDQPPVLTTSPKSQSPVPGEKPLSERKASILLVDDQPANLLVLRAILDDQGLHLVEAHSGEQALRRVLDEDFAVVLLDVQMPGQNGFETARLIRDREKNRHTPIIFLTAYDSDRKTLEMAYSLGAVDFLVKPLIPVILKAKVTSFVELFEEKERAKRLLEHKQRERLREVETHLQIVTESMAAPVTRCSRDLRFLWVSKPYADWIGRPQDEIVGRPISEIMGESAFKQLRRHFEQVLAGNKVQYEEEVNYRGLGLRWINAMYTPTMDAEGAPDGWVAVVLDVTNRRKMEQALRDSEEALKEADRRKDEFLATLAHELRNPLAPICYAVELMKNTDGDAALLEEARKIMERQLQQMVRLVDDLLDISRITRGKLQLRKELVELAAVVQTALEATRTLIESQSHEFTVTLPAETVHLDADPVRLAQVFSNLFNNAAKYTETGGHIWLTVERQAGEVVAMVRDTGIGIAAEHLPHLFEMFSQVTPALERSQGGLGIGLALVQGLVELHGGRVEAHSAGPGRGSEFIVRLPVVDTPKQAPQEPGGGNEKATAGPKYRILIADDLRDSVESLAIMVRLSGHVVQTALNGLEAVQDAATFRPDLLLLDIGMPKMNGYEVARHIREQPWGKKMILVALTGWGQEEDKRRATEAGFDHHMTKPVSLDALKRLLASLEATVSPRQA